MKKELAHNFQPREIFGRLIEDENGYRVVTDWRDINIGFFDKKTMHKVIQHCLWDYVKLKGWYNKTLNQFIVKQVSPASEPLGLDLLVYGPDAELDLQACRQKIKKEGYLQAESDEFAS